MAERERVNAAIEVAHREYREWLEADRSRLLRLRREISAKAWDEGVQWARDQIKEWAEYANGGRETFHRNDVIQPHFDALDAVPNGLGYSGYNAHIANVAFHSAIDTITPDLDPPEGYEPDDDPNPYRGGAV